MILITDVLRQWITPIHVAFAYGTRLRAKCLENGSRQESGRGRQEVGRHQGCMFPKNLCGPSRHELLAADLRRAAEGDGVQVRGGPGAASAERVHLSALLGEGQLRGVREPLSAHRRGTEVCEEQGCR